MIKNKTALLLIGIIFVVVAVSGCSSNTNHFSGNSISFDYPKNWTEQNSDSSMILAIVVDQNNNLTGTIITSPPTDLSSAFAVGVESTSLEGTVDIFKNSLTRSGVVIVSETPTKVNNLNAVQLTVQYKGTGNQDMKGTHTIIEKSKGETYYDIFNYAKAGEFDQNKPNFDIIINSLKT